MACEKNLLEAELDYAQRMHDTNEAIATSSFAELEQKLGTEHKDVFLEYKAAANTCAEIHRNNEHAKQQKNWAYALNNVEANNLGLKARKPRNNNQKPRRSPPQQPTAGPSGQSPRRDNRTFLRAKRHLPPKQNNAQRPRGQGARRANNGTPNADIMATALKIATALSN